MGLLRVGCEVVARGMQGCRAQDAGLSCVGCEIVVHGMRGCCVWDAGSHLKYSHSMSRVVMPKARDVGFLERGSDDGHGRGLEMTRVSAAGETAPS